VEVDELDAVVPDPDDVAVPGVVPHLREPGGRSRVDGVLAEAERAPTRSANRYGWWAGRSSSAGGSTGLK
jgi:hypothetical protein